jgi:hypothetical protein
MKAMIQPKLAGRYLMVAVKPDGTERHLAEFDNLLTDVGLNQIGVGTPFGWAQVGSGSVAPANTDTALQTHVASTNSNTASATGVQSATPYYGWVRQTYRFAAGVAAGNLSEVGIGWGTSGNLLSRSLIKDSDDNPTTITVLSDEVLDITYELQIYPPDADVDFDVTISGVTYACVLRAAGVTGNQWDPSFMPAYGGSQGFAVALVQGPIGPITAMPSGGSYANVNATMDAYSNNSLTRTGVASYTLDQGNSVDGIAAVVIQSQFAGTYQVSFTPPIPKDNTRVLSLNCSLSWARKV